MVYAPGIETGLGLVGVDELGRAFVYAKVDGVPVWVRLPGDENRG